MAERDPHSIQSLLYVERNGNYYGYKPELIPVNISTDIREFLICSECKGICRSPRKVGDDNTVCEMCVTGKAGNLDEGIENTITSLNSKCPLWENGCEWEGKLLEIEQHMEVCVKKYIIESEKEITEQESKEVHSQRIVKCQYCELEIQARHIETQHIGECTQHPDTQIPCPYEDLGCDVITPRKYKDLHLTENTIDHQMLVIDQLEKLRNRITLLFRLERLRGRRLDRFEDFQDLIDERHELLNNRLKILRDRQTMLDDRQRHTFWKGSVATAVMGIGVGFGIALLMRLLS